MTAYTGYKEKNPSARQRKEIDGKAEGSQFVTFTLAEEEYGIDILHVQEIIGYKKFTKIPNVVEFVKGVLNLRGAVVPVIDMRLKFGMPERPYDASTVIMIVELGGKTMGVIVDSVSDVVTLLPHEIQETPDFASSIRTDFIQGMGKKDDAFIILLDIDRVLSMEEIKNISQAV